MKESVADAGMIAINRAVAVIDAVNQGKLVSLAETARAVGLSEPTTLRYLSALRQHHIVTRDPDSGKYHLGVRLSDWGATAPAVVDPRTAAAEPLKKLAATLGETVELAGIEGGQVIILDTRAGGRAVGKLVSIGDIEEWHCTSVCKAILSQASPSFLDMMLPTLKYTAFTRNTLTSEALLRADLEASRERGYAVDDEESEEGLRCIGVALRDRKGEYHFGISASGPAYRMSPPRDESIAAHLRQAAQAIEEAMGLPPAS
jgi:IclR family acetate operon transcriptional repressor